MPDDQGEWLDTLTRIHLRATEAQNERLAQLSEEAMELDDEPPPVSDALRDFLERQFGPGNGDHPHARWFAKYEQGRLGALTGYLCRRCAPRDGTVAAKRLQLFPIRPGNEFLYQPQCAQCGVRGA